MCVCMCVFVRVSSTLPLRMTCALDRLIKGVYSSRFGSKIRAKFRNSLINWSEAEGYHPTSSFCNASAMRPAPSCKKKNEKQNMRRLPSATAVLCTQLLLLCLCLCLSFARARGRSFFLSFFLAYSLSLSVCLSVSLSVSLTPPHTTHTHTHTHTHLCRK